MRAALRAQRRHARDGAATARALVAAERTASPPTAPRASRSTAGTCATGAPAARGPGVARDRRPRAWSTRAGLAFEACALAGARRSPRARSTASRSSRSPTATISASPPITSSRSPQAGLVGLAFGNSPAAMPAWGGKRALFGTNPIAARFPRRERRRS
jgi:(2R)-3-sulfolactate dehydrogenase (NADP+)